MFVLYSNYNPYNDGSPESRQPYNGGFNTVCNHCHHVVNQRYCPFCNNDLSNIYTVADAKFTMDKYLNSNPNYNYSNYYTQPNPYQQQNQYNQPNPYQQQNQYNQPNPYQQQNQYTQPNPYQQQNQYTQPNPYQQQNQYTQPNLYQQVYRPVKKPKEKTVITKNGIALGISMAVLFVVVFVSTMIILYSITDHSQSPTVNTHQQQTEIDLNNNPAGVSKAELAKLKSGMSYAQVSAIIGGDGLPTKSHQNSLKQDVIIYWWPYEDDNSAGILITFTDEQLTSIKEASYDSPELKK